MTSVISVETDSKSAEDSGVSAMTKQVIAFSCLARHAEFMTMTVATESHAESTLRKVMMANTGFSVTTGLVGLILGGPTADTLGVDQVWLIRLLGAGLLGFAAIVFLVARSTQPVLQRWSREISMADIGWVIGTAVVIALGWLSTSGAVVMAIVGAAVLALGLAQQHFRSAMVAQAT